MGRFSWPPSAKLHPDPEIVLFARSGFTKGLREAAASREHLHLVELSDLAPSGAADG